MADKDKAGNWIDPTGHPVPVKYIGKVEKQRDVTVEKIFSAGVKLQKEMSKFKVLALGDVDKYLDWLASENGIEALNKGGNYELANFSANRKVYIKVNKTIELDERLQLAKTLIDECLVSWSKNADQNLKAVVMHAFRVDTKGRVNIRAILSLLKLNIKDAQWAKAMELIKQAITVIGSKQYIFLQMRPNPRAEWQTIRLDLAGV